MTATLPPGYVEIPQHELEALAAAFDEAPEFPTDPQVWLADELGEYAWQLQREIWAAVGEHTRVAVLSCNNSGKTWLAARIVVYWVMRYWRAGVRVVTTAPTAAQVSLLLWQEIKTAYRKLTDRGRKPPGRVVSSPFPQWKIGDASAAWGRKPADHEASAMQGVHAPHVLVVLDEAGGVAKAIWDGAEKITTTGHTAVLAIGNPDDIATPFGQVTRPGSGWHVIRVDGLRTPNFTADRLAGLPLTRALMVHEGIPFNTEPVPESIREVMLQPEFVEGALVRIAGVDPSAPDRLEQAELGQYIADRADASQLFTAMVRGRFPANTKESVIPLAWVLRAVERWKDWELGDPAVGTPPRATPLGRLVAGIDVATPNGADRTVIALRAGHVVTAVHVYPEADTDDTIAHLLEHVDNIPQAIAVPDVIGVGAGVADGLQNRTSVSVARFTASAQSDRTDRHGRFRFNNDRSAAWWRLREKLDPAYGADLCLPPDEDLIAELTTPRWRVRTAKGRPIIMVESKDEVRKRLGRSPDLADGVVQSVWVDGAPVDTSPQGSSAIPWGGPPPGQAAHDLHKGAGVIAYDVGTDGEDDW